MIKVAMMQPTFLPWMGYFELIAKADKFIFLDDFQFVYQSFHIRNRIFFNKNVVGWLTVPVDKKHDFCKPINEVNILEDSTWRKKLWRSLENNYGKTPYFSAYAEILKPLLVNPQYNLGKQNINLILAVSNILGLKCEFLYSSKIPVEGKRSLRIKNLLEKVGTDIYLSAHGSFGYMYEDKIFPLENIECLFQNAELDEYPQHGSKNEFVPFLSIIDALFNVGAEETFRLVSNVTKHWKTWQEMASEYGSTGNGGGYRRRNRRALTFKLIKIRQRYLKSSFGTQSFSMFCEAA